MSPDALSTDLAKAPPEMVSDVRARGFAFYAADLRREPGDTFMENVGAIVYPHPTRITQDFLDGTVAEMVDGFRKAVQSYKLIDKKLVAVGGVNAGRVVNEFESNHVKVRTLAYILPGRTSFAVLTYTTKADDFERYAPIFDAAARATAGVAEPSAPHLPAWLLGAMGGVLGGLVARKFMAKKKA